jgi:23S rRNA-/tRNA-specific pseudouridylate synthase
MMLRAISLKFTTIGATIDAGIKREISNLKRFYLHAVGLIFKHPGTKEKMDFTSPLPHRLNDTLTLIA